MGYSKGEILKGKIIYVAEKYLLVKFPNNKNGLLHKFKMSPQPNGDLNHLYRINQCILVSIDGITKKGYSLGRKDIENRFENQQRHKANELEKQKMAEERELMDALVKSSASQFERGGIYEAEVIKLYNQVAKISINGVDGYIEKNELNWNENDSVKESLFEGEIIHAVFLEYTDGKLLFGLKYLEEKPYDDDLYSLSTEELLTRWRHASNVFVAEAKNINGLCLTNLYSYEGNLLVDPFKGNNIVIRNLQQTFEEGKFYKIEIQLIEESVRRNNNDLFSFYISKAEEAANPYKADVEKAFSWYRTPASNSSLANILDTVGLEMYSSAERMFFELIQNADDAASQGGVIFTIDRINNYLIFTHNGFHFSQKDFFSLVSAAKSTKSSIEKTGYKGIGFKSVFTNSQQVYVCSGGFHFKFDKYEASFDDFDKFYSLVNSFKDELQFGQFIDDFKIYRDAFRGVKDIPWQLLPIWYDDIPESLKKSIYSKNQKVSFALNIKNNKIEDYVEAIEYLFDNPKFILFLRHTNRLDLKFSNKIITKEVKNGVVTIKNSFSEKRIERLIKRDFDEIAVSNKAFTDKDIDIQIKEIINKQGEKENKFYDTNNQELEDVPNRITSSKSTTISFVANYDDNTISEAQGNSLYAYLPMNEHRFRFPLYINADFVLAANRETLLDNPWNYYLLSNIGELLIKWVAELANKGEKACLKLLPLQYFDDSTLDVKQLAHSFNSAYRAALKKEPFILNHKNKFAHQDEIILDKTGLSEILGAEIFCKLLRTSKCLPSKMIDSKILREEIFEDVEILKFDKVLKTILNNKDFNEWFISATEEQKQALYNWINKNTKMQEDVLQSFVLYLPLFKFGEKNISYKEIESHDNIITTKHIAPIKEILIKLGFVCSDNVFDKNHPLYVYFNLQDEDELFNSIKKCDFSKLETNERKMLFFALADFDDVGEAKLKTIALFRNINGEAMPLGELVAYRENVPEWMCPYVICKDDYDNKLSSYIVKQEDEFVNIIQAHFQDIKTSATELYKAYKNQWTGQFTRHIIDKNEINDDSLSVIEESDNNTKEYFLKSIKKLDLLSDSTYKKDSYEYRVLQLALSVYDEPSCFSAKIYYNGQCIRNFSVSDDVICDFSQNGETKKVIMSLSILLPKYRNQTDSINKVKALFEQKRVLDKFFIANPKSIDEVYRELNKYLNIPESIFSVWNVDGNAFQYLFVTYYRRQKNGWYDSLVPEIELSDETDEFLNDLLDFLFNNDISVNESPLTYHLKKYFSDKFFDSDFIFVNEQLLPVIEKWADDEKKKKYLITNGVYAPDCLAIQFRQFFLKNEPIDFIDKLSDVDLKSGIVFIATASGYKRPFVGKNQRCILLSVKDKCSNFLSDCWDNEKIHENANEWNTVEYNEWIENHHPHIFIYPGSLPSQLLYNNEAILNYENTDYYYYEDKNEHNLIISNNHKIDDILFEVAKNKNSDFDLDDYKILCLEGKVFVSKEEIADTEKRIQSLSEENEKKDKIIKQYKAKYGDLISDEKNNSYVNYKQIFDEAQKNICISLSKVIRHDKLTPKKQITAHVEAEQIIRGELEKNGYDCSNWNNKDINKYEDWHSFSQVNNIIRPDGEAINLVVKSAIGGYIFLSATDFEFLTSDNNNVLMVWDGIKVHSVTANDIFNKDSNVNLIFDTEYTPKHYYAALSKVFQYVKRTTFAVKNPNYNAYDTIKSFGMDSKTEGVQELFDDNDL